MTSYVQGDLVLPTLRLLRDHPSGLTTTQLIELLIQDLHPSGQDLEPYPGRPDKEPRFSQTVRNLLGSHHVLDSEGLATYSGPRQTWMITEKGLDYLLENEPDSPEDLQAAVHALQEQGIETRGEVQPLESYAGVVIEEGAITQRSVNQRTRSRRLRDAAINAFKQQHDGKLYCTVCGFDFEAKYGELGRDFIEIHHTEAIREGEPVDLMIALERVAPLCANCHRMIHRQLGVTIALQELQAIVAHVERHSR
ncbi:hypothetical protein ES703_102303 [subsurface metagenome]